MNDIQNKVWHLGGRPVMSDKPEDGKGMIFIEDLDELVTKLKKTISVKLGHKHMNEVIDGILKYEENK